jgi:hypothetical protein
MAIDFLYTGCFYLILEAPLFLASIATDSVPLLGKKWIILGLKVVYLDMISLMSIKDQRPQGMKFILKF